MIKPATVALLLGSVVPAQFEPELFVTEAYSTQSGPSPLSFGISGPIGTPFGILVDLDGGPVELLGERFELGLTGTQFAAFSGVISGFPESRSLPVVPMPALVGQALFAQGVLLSPMAPNGAFGVTNGESVVFHDAPSAIVERFDSPALEGFSGSYDRMVAGRLSGVFDVREVQPVQAGQRMENPPPSSGLTSGLATPFAFGIQNPLNPRGSRAQFVYRARDLLATGEPAVVTGISWRAHDGSPVVLDTFDDVQIYLSHSDIVPNYSLSAFTQVSEFPESGLSSAFISNLLQGGLQQQVRNGPYVVDPSLVELKGAPTLGQYLDWGINPSFIYNGVDSLLIEFRVPASASASGVNGAQVHLPILSGPNPASRTVASLPATTPGTLDPDAAFSGNFVDNTIHDILVEFTRIEAEAVSPFRDSGMASPDYDPAILAAQMPAGTSIQIEYRGADDRNGLNATPFSADVNVADGRSHLQYRVRFVSDLASGAIPTIDTLVIPVR